MASILNGPYTTKPTDASGIGTLLLDGDGDSLAVFFDESDAEYVRGVLDVVYAQQMGLIKAPQGIDVEALQSALLAQSEAAEKGD